MLSSDRRPSRRAALPAPLTLAAALAVVAVVAGGCGGSATAPSAVPPQAPGPADTAPAAPPSPATPPATSTVTGKAFTDQGAAAVRDDAVAAMQAAGSFRFKGTYVSAGVPARLDLRVDSAGDCTGTFGIGDGTAQVLGVGGTYWFRPDAAYWRAAVGAQAPSVIAQVGQKWVVNPALAATCQPTSLFASAAEAKARHQLKGRASVYGHPVVKVTSTDDAGTSVGYVVLSAPHYLIELRRTGTSTAHFLFGEFGVPLDVQAPAADDQTTLSQLTGGG